MSTGFPAANAPALAAATPQLWLHDELAYAWRAAQNEAVAAYEARRPVAGAPPGRRPHTGARAGRPHRGPTWQGWSSPTTRSLAPDGVIATRGPLSAADEHMTGYYVVDCDGPERARAIAERTLDRHVPAVELREIHDSSGF